MPNLISRQRDESLDLCCRLASLARENTLYATAFFDAGKEPWVLGIPDSPMCTTPDLIPGHC
jgi:hypothetical protein